MKTKNITNATKSFKTAETAFAHIEHIYNTNTAYLRAQFQNYGTDAFKKGQRATANYPYIKIATKQAKRADIRMAYGFAPQPGEYATTVTRPDIFQNYYREQLNLILKNHDIAIEIGVSNTPIPIHFALGEDFHLEGDLTEAQLRDLPYTFDVPDLSIMDDEIANGTHITPPGEDAPLALFTAPRVDLSLQRLKHYTGTTADNFQNFVIFTNYQFYIDEFIMIGKSQAGKDGYTNFIMPPEGSRMPQMPAYHMIRPDNSGITMVNIGVGPSNAKTITDHIAVLRPHAWFMLGHCAGLRNSQKLGDYVLAHAYLRQDNILNEAVPLEIPIPALAEIQQALQAAVAEISGFDNYELKKIMRTGTVATTDDRNWELRASHLQNLRLSQSRAIAMDMESGTIAANGFRFRVPYGTLLCVSDKPLHGQLKLPGMANTFYRERVEQHLKVGLLTMKLLRDTPPEKLHSRKLRSFNEVAFQ